MDLIKKLEKKYPDIEWETAEPAAEVTNDYGDGIIIIGKKNGEAKGFFVLTADKKREQWGDVIANNLREITKEKK